MKLFTKILICALFMGGFYACEKDKDFSDIPELTFRDFERTSPSSAIWKIGFTDGDGDVGLIDIGDTSQDDNFIVTIISIKDGLDSAMQGQNYRVPVVENIRTAAGIEGEIKLDITGLDVFKLIQSPKIDSIYYRGYLLDRKGNQSNFVETPKIKI